MALALYRKYRPRTFAELIGQDHVTEPLSQALRSGRLHHAYLFSGPRGCGKTSSARILARSLNCERGPTPEPCGVCGSCKSLAGDGTGSLDVIEIDAASHGGVDDARELRERAFFAPASSRFKIYVIDEAHMVSTQGFNALLKLVEEPPEYVKFIFATTEPDKVLGTIKSRTHHYPFRLIPPGVLRPYLEQLASAEGVKVEPAVFPLVVRAGGGSARDSLSVLDQLIAGAGPDGVSYAGAVALLGVTDAALIDEMCDAIAAGDGAAAFGTIDRVAEAGHDARRFASDLLERLRDLIVLQQVPDAATKGLIDGPTDQLERMASQAQRLGPATLSRGADIVHNGLIEMRGTTAPRLLLELIVARILLPAADEGEGALLQRMERMERRLTIQGPDEGVRQPAAPPAPQGAPGGRAVPAGQAGNAQRAATSSGDEPGAARSGAMASDGPPSAASAVRPTRGRPTTASAGQPTAGAGGRPTAASAEQHIGGAGGPDAGAAGQPTAGTEGGSASAGQSAGGMAAATAGLAGQPTAGTEGGPASAGQSAGGMTAATAGSAGQLTGGGSTGAASAGDPAGTTAQYGDATFAGAAPAGQLGAGQAQAAAAPARPAPSAVMADPATPEPVIPSSAPPAEIDAVAVRRVWDEILAMVGQKSKKVAAWACEATVRDIDGNTLVLTFRHSFHARALSEQPELISEAAYEVLGTRWQIRCEMAGDQRQISSPPAQNRPAAPAPAAQQAPNGQTPAAQPQAAADEDWPETATLGGPPPVPQTPPTQPPKGKPTPTPAAEAPTDPRAAARAAASGRGRPAADAEWAGEPPYDPEFDGPAKPAGPPPPEVAAQSVPYEGFDPGDVPTDEVIDEKTARQTSEQQAVQLLQQALGAERIGEVELK